MCAFSFESSVRREVDTTATGQTLQDVISPLLDDADSIISGSLGGHIPPLSPHLIFTIPTTKSCKHPAEASQLRVGVGR